MQIAGVRRSWAAAADRQEEALKRWASLKAMELLAAPTHAHMHARWPASSPSPADLALASANHAGVGAVRRGSGVCRVQVAPHLRAWLRRRSCKSARPRWLVSGCVLSFCGLT
jgi:hypothetical protein